MAESKIVISEYELRMPFNAPRINLQKGEKMNFKPFAAGEKVKGFVLRNEDPQVALPPDMQVIITEDYKWAIPMRAITFIKDVLVDGKPVVDKNANPNDVINLPNAIREKLQALKSSDIIGNVIKTSHASANGMLYGALAGGVFALFTKRSVVGWSAVGAVAGTFIGYKYSQLAVKKEVEQEITGTAPEVAEEPIKP